MAVLKFETGFAPFFWAFDRTFTENARTYRELDRTFKESFECTALLRPFFWPLSRTFTENGRTKTETSPYQDGNDSFLFNIEPYFHGKTAVPSRKASVLSRTILRTFAVKDRTNEGKKPYLQRSVKYFNSTLYGLIPTKTSRMYVGSLIKSLLTTTNGNRTKTEKVLIQGARA